ncbi:MAG: hypothetical protein H5U22_06715 [Rhizobium sp.]|nr:hypothetical protein [Rhizobium sp.]
MYHEERVIDGMLHWRGTQGGRWVQYGPRHLTERIAKNASAASALQAQNEWLKYRLAELQLPSTKRDYDTREKWLLQCGMPAGDA